MDHTDRTERLIDVMRQRDLSIRDVSVLLDRNEKTVRMWRSKGEPDIPAHLLELLELKLALSGLEAADE